LLEADRNQRRSRLMKELQIGQIRTGVVKNITDFGAFIDLGGVDGLLHITDMSWGRVNHPSEIVALGDKLKVKVLDFNENKERISLGLKQLTEHPWKGIEEKFPEGQKVRGKIVSITDYGAFMELEKGIEGLIHISEMSWTQHIKHPSKIVGIGDIVEAMVLKIDKENQKISLGLKQLEPDPWENIAGEFPVDTILSGKVRNIAAFGAFVELKEGVDGLVHISDMSWTRKVNHPGEILHKGDTVQVKVLDIDEAKRRISLGIKQLTGDPWGELATKYGVGTEVDCEVARILDRGIIVVLSADIEGFIPLNQFGRDVKHPSDAYAVGDKVPGKVIEFDMEGRKIVLSIAEYFNSREDGDWKAHCEKYPVKENTVRKGKKDKKAGDEKVKDEQSATDESVPAAAEAPVVAEDSAA
jgi:small subunit ribosomal protein S1